MSVINLSAEFGLSNVVCNVDDKRASSAVSLELREQNDNINISLSRNDDK